MLSASALALQDQEKAYNLKNLTPSPKVKKKCGEGISIEKVSEGLRISSRANGENISLLKLISKED